MARIKNKLEESAASRLARYDRIIQAVRFAGLETTQCAIGNSLRPPVGQAAVSCWKRSNPSIGHLIQLIKMTGVNGHWLLTGEGRRTIADHDSEVSDAIQVLIDGLSADARAQVLGRVQKLRGE